MQLRDAWMYADNEEKTGFGSLEAPRDKACKKGLVLGDVLAPWAAVIQQEADNLFIHAGSYA